MEPRILICTKSQGSKRVLEQYEDKAYKIRIIQTYITKKKWKDNGSGTDFGENLRMGAVCNEKLEH
jgi:hypothetical protein